jgi:hypothetical protein
MNQQVDQYLAQPPGCQVQVRVCSAKSLQVALMGRSGTELYQLAVWTLTAGRIPQLVANTNSCRISSHRSEPHDDGTYCRKWNGQSWGKICNYSVIVLAGFSKQGKCGHGGCVKEMVTVAMVLSIGVLLCVCCYGNQQGWSWVVSGIWDSWS